MAASFLVEIRLPPRHLAGPLLASVAHVSPVRLACAACLTCSCIPHPRRCAVRRTHRTHRTHRTTEPEVPHLDALVLGPPLYPSS